MIVKMFGMCDKNKSIGDYPHVNWLNNGGNSDGKCYKAMTFVGKEACPLDLDEMLAPLYKFSGAIEIGLGAVLLFIGSKFIVWAFILVSMLLVSLLTFIVLVNLGFADKILEGHIGVYIGFGVGSLIAGILVAICLCKFAFKYMTAMFAFIAAGVIVAVVAAPIQNVKSLRGSKIIYWVIVVIAAVIGFLLGKKLDRPVRCLGTAVVGAFMVGHGISQYLGGFPSIVLSGGFDGASLDKTDFPKNFKFYIVGMVIGAIFGFFI